MGDKIYVAKQDTLEAVQQTVNETNTTMGKMDDPAGEDSLVALVKNIPNNVKNSCVKSIQYGTVNKTGSVVISPVDTTKSFVLVSGSAPNGSHDACLYLAEFTSNHLRLTSMFANDGSTAHGSWIVVEMN